MDPKVARKIEALLARGENTIVLTRRKGKIPRVMPYATYQKIKENPKINKPWQYREANRRPDPLGAIDGKVLGPLSRADFYEEDKAN